MRAEYLECGKIINTHGTGGVLKLECRCDSPDILAGLEKVYFKSGEVYTGVSVERASVHGSFVLAKLEGVGDIGDAERLRGEVVYAPRGDIPMNKGAHFIADLIGLEVIDAASGQIYGRIKEVINAGASDIYVISTDGGERMMPAVSEFVRSIDLERGIFISPIEGMF